MPTPTPIGLFRGEDALVTGSASNIGRAIALALAREGAGVRCVDVDADRNGSVVAEIRQAGGRAEAVTADLSNAHGWRAALPPEASACAMFVHSASPARKEVDGALAVSEETFDQMLNTNVRSGFLLARELGRRMRAAAIKGRMLFITSLHAETPRNIPHYSASKAAQTMVVKELARALGPAGIRINALAPGAVPGGGFNAAAFDFAGKIPLGRLGRADDMADMALALLSDRFAGYVTGTTVVVDGGIALYNWIPLPAP
jgi:3-oxoacyl-[acyl-carrier protein] reductase